jgi:hypothetical protein
MQGPFSGSISQQSSSNKSSQQDESNMFLKNLDRAMLTFNLHNIGEVCFNHVFKRKAFKEDSPLVDIQSQGRLTDEQQRLIDECIDKYMQSFKVV